MPRYAITARYNDQTTEEVARIQVDGGPGFWLALEGAAERLRPEAAGHDPEIESLTIERIPEVAS